MKTTNSILPAICLATLLLPFINSCKKGPDDPLISFRSRAARVEGDWHATKYNLTETETATSSNCTSNCTGTSTETINGNNIILTDGTFTYTGTITTNSMKFTKDGNWTANEVYSLSGNIQGQTENVNISSTSNGTWKFNSAMDGYKNKESITITQLSATDVFTVTYNGSSSTDTKTNTSAEVQVWHLIGLRDKKMEFELGENYTHTITDNNGTTVTTISKGGLSGTFEQ